MKDDGGGKEARDIAAGIRHGRQFQAMRVAMEERAYTDDHRCGDSRHLHLEGDEQAEQRNACGNPGLDQRKLDAIDPEQRAERHDDHEGCRHDEARPAFECRRPEADRDHGQDMIEPAERMGKAGAQAIGMVARMRLRDRGHGRERDGGQESCVVHDGSPQAVRAATSARRS